MTGVMLDCDHEWVEAGGLRVTRNPPAGWYWLIRCQNCGEKRWEWFE